MKKIIWLLFISLLFSCSFERKKGILFLGNELQRIDFVDYLKEEKSQEVNDAFLMKDGYISFLYTFLVKDAQKENESLKSAIKKSKSIYLYIGHSDIYRCIFDDNATYDENIVANQKELFSYYFFLILEEIREIFANDIYLFSPYVLNYKTEEEKYVLEKITDDFFAVFQEVADYFSCKLIDLRSIPLLVNNDEKEICEYIFQQVKYGD